MQKYKSPLLPIEYVELGTEAAYDEMIFEKVTFIEDFGPIKKGSYFDSLYISFTSGFIHVINHKEEYEEIFSVQLKIKEANA